MTYELDSTPTGEEPHATTDSESAHDDDGCTTDGSAAGGLEESLGVTIPDDHVGAFVAQAFEDVERSTEWEEAIDSVVADEARDAWNRLEPRKQVIELLKMADQFDRKATALLEEIPLDRGGLDDDLREQFDDAKRLRRNADVVRDGIAAGYAEGRVSDDELVDAVETFEFDTAAIAEREDALDDVANAYNLDFRPYGGTLMNERDPDDDAEEFEAW
ncbi:hypothetical protein NP511_02950 [Natrinema thermotolerans]|uniref:Uncharacterized protein n=1 Tax=Natrinema thermotolerans TaxID=121872 RepID=A0AAF0T6K1_9EURY|nr:hypothetical protein [Natrinema thermotolerans]QCC57520.1 hypothetical protein DVR14_02235 [Natrinema thermotolerans]WMT08599.1 hypothetical protein NP511_02950 [Natrinema thermotolerans]